MDVRSHAVSLDEPLLDHVASWLLQHAPHARDGDLADVMVVLPAARPGGRLRHLLLSLSGRDVLLLPRIVTPQQLADELAPRLGCADATVPHPDLRAAMLAQQLAAAGTAPSWLQEFRESAPGIAAELIRLFDELRLHGRIDILEGDPPARADCDTSAGPAGELHAEDLARVRDGWRLYRQLVPCDGVDRTLEVVDRLRNNHQGQRRPLALTVAAGFTDLDPTRAELIRHGLSLGEPHLFQIAADDPLSRLLLASYADARSDVHPLQPSGRIAKTFSVSTDQRQERAPAGASTPGDAGAPVEPASSFRERLDILSSDPRSPSGHFDLELLACSDPEEESRVVTELVVGELEVHRGRLEAASPEDRCGALVAVATADRDLARRIAAQLSDAGIQVEDTAGIKLAQLPAGLLTLTMLNVVLTDWRHDHLLELLTHPFVRIANDADTHRRQTSYLERMIRGEQRPRGGLQAYRSLASNRKDALDNRWRIDTTEMIEFIDLLGNALSPLVDLVKAGACDWRAFFEAFHEAWSRLAPDHKLDTAGEKDDEKGLARLLDEMETTFCGDSAVTGRLRTAFGELAASVMRLVADRTVRPRRSEFLPVLVTGLLEARLEYYDMLILAGMSEDVFPGRIERPLFLTEGHRRTLGMPGWREQQAEKSELFLRLVHGGGSIVITWSMEKLGQPCLPSPLVVRLGMGGRVPCTRAAAAAVYRRSGEMPPLSVIAEHQALFAGESAAIPVAGRSRPLRRLSHTAISTYRDCPYRFLLERGFNLTPEEEVLDEFRKLDYGNVVHECLRDFLKPGGAGQANLVAGDADGSADVLRKIAAREFAKGAQELPQRRLWEQSFRQCVGAIVAAELERFSNGWRPSILEEEFTLRVGALHDWLAGAGDALDETAPPDCDAEARSLPIKGKIDRIDIHAARSGIAAVIDYKTGRISTTRAVRDGRDLQLVLYAVAVELGVVERLKPADGWQVDHAAFYEIASERSGFVAGKPHLALTDDDGRAVLLHGALEILRAALAARDRGRPFALIPEHWNEAQPGRLPCGTCPFHGVCRLEERLLPPHLDIKLHKEMSARKRS